MMGGAIKARFSISLPLHALRAAHIADQDPPKVKGAFDSGAERRRNSLSSTRLRCLPPLSHLTRCLMSYPHWASRHAATFQDANSFT